MRKSSLVGLVLGAVVFLLAFGQYVSNVQMRQRTIQLWSRASQKAHDTDAKFKEIMQGSSGDKKTQVKTLLLEDAKDPDGLITFLNNTLELKTQVLDLMQRYGFDEEEVGMIFGAGTKP